MADGKSHREVAADILCTLIENKYIKPESSTTEIVESVAEAFKVIFEAVNNPN